MPFLSSSNSSTEKDIPLCTKILSTIRRMILKYLKRKKYPLYLLTTPAGLHDSLESTLQIRREV
jgi:hypothetical protein